MLSTRPVLLMTAATLTLLLLARGEACGSFISDGGSLLGAGPNIINVINPAGYDLYGTVAPDSSFGETHDLSFGRISQIPAYVNAINPLGTDVYYGSPSYPIVNVPGQVQRRIGLLDNVELENTGLGKERNVVSFTVNSSVPVSFSLGVIVSNYGNVNYEYVDQFRLRSTSSNGPSFTLITHQDTTKQGLDAYFFNISNASPGETFVLSGWEFDHKPNGYNSIQISGLTFSQTAAVPEPSSILMLTTGSLCLSAFEWRRRRSIRA